MWLAISSEEVSLGDPNEEPGRNNAGAPRPLCPLLLGYTVEGVGAAAGAAFRGWAMRDSVGSGRESGEQIGGNAPATADHNRSDFSPGGLYADFEIEIGLGTGRSYPVAVIRSPAGEARGTMEFPYDEVALDSRLKDLQVALLRSGGARRKVLTPEESGVRKFGEDIFDALLAGEARSRYDVSCRDARRRGQGLRLKLRIRPPELALLPWEYLYDSRVGEYICLSRDTPVVRFLETTQPIEPLKVTPPLRILAMIVGPQDLPQLNTDRERERVERALAPLQRAGLVELVWLHGGTWRDLQRAMRGGPWHIFHFVGHGGFDTGAQEGVLSLVDEQGRAQRLLATEVGRLLADHHSLRLVMINACEGARASREDIFSSTAAVLVRRGLPAVLAMQHEITDRAAIEFARAFYESLAEGLPVDASVGEARKAVSLAVANTMEWGTPVLYMRTPDGVIFEIPPSTHHPGPSDLHQPNQDTLAAPYTEALSAYWVGDWATACEHLQAIVAEDPDYADAASKLAEAKQRRAWESLYAEACLAEQEGDLPGAIKALEELVAQAPDYLDAESLLAGLRKQSRLEELETEAKRLSEAQQWRAVVGVFAEIQDLDPHYPDEEGLLSTAQQEVEELLQLEKLEAQYARAVRQMECDDWNQARLLLLEIQSVDPEHRETAQLIAKCENELTELAAAKARTDQIATLYEEAGALVEAEQWRDALAKLDELAQLEPGFSDSERIGEQAQAALDATHAQAERQKEAAALYAEAVQAVKSERYEDALDKWQAVELIDPSFIDRRKVQATARQKLTRAQPRPRIRSRRYLWRIMAGAIAVLVVFLGAIALLPRSSDGPQATDTEREATNDDPGGAEQPDASTSNSVVTDDQQPSSYRVHVRISTTSNWTTFSLSDGGQWRNPIVLSWSAQSETARFEGEGFLLTQSVEAAESGRSIEMTADTSFANFDREGDLLFEIARGHIGQTRVELSVGSDDSREQIRVLTHDAIRPGDPRNVESFWVTAEDFLGAGDDG